MLVIAARHVGACRCAVVRQEGRVRAYDVVQDRFLLVRLLSVGVQRRGKGGKTGCVLGLGLRNLFVGHEGSWWYCRNLLVGGSRQYPACMVWTASGRRSRIERNSLGQMYATTGLD